MKERIRCWECSKNAKILVIIRYEDNDNRTYPVSFCSDSSCQDEFFKRNPNAEIIKTRNID
jgi:hypothetical protein